MFANLMVHTGSSLYLVEMIILPTLQFVLKLWCNFKSKVTYLIFVKLDIRLQTTQLDFEVQLPKMSGDVQDTHLCSFYMRTWKKVILLQVIKKPELQGETCSLIQGEILLI